MTLYQFNLLDEMEQMEAIWEAVKLVERSDDTFHYNLYQIDDFYVEEKIHIAYDARHAFRSFKTTELLKPYLDQMNINFFE